MFQVSGVYFPGFWDTVTWLVDVSESIFRSWCASNTKSYRKLCRMRKVLLFASLLSIYLEFNDFRRHLYPFDYSKILIRLRINYKIYIKVDINSI